MALFLKKRKQDIGLSPDELLFKGEKKTDKVTLKIIDFDSNNEEEKVLKSVDDILNYQSKESVTWFNIDGLHDETVMHDISKAFQLDKLILADVMNTQARPVIVEHSNCIFISLKMLQWNDNIEEISS